MSALGQKQIFASAIVMSALGQKQTFAMQQVMSAFPPKATSNATYSGHHARRHAEVSLDHIVGQGEQSIWNGEPKRFCSPEIDHEFKLSRLLHGQVGRLRALEN